ncbi:MAG: hypothetical protein ABIQ73_30330 [Acidimicrobiales bacterium]
MVVVGGRVVVVAVVGDDVVARVVVLVAVVAAGTVVVEMTVTEDPLVSTLASPFPLLESGMHPASARTAIGALIFAHSGHPR